MLIEELEEALSDLLDSEFTIEIGKGGEVIIFTGLAINDDDGELFELDDDGSDDDDDSFFDEDVEQLEDEDDDED